MRTLGYIAGFLIILFLAGTALAAGWMILSPNDQDPEQGSSSAADVVIEEVTLVPVEANPTSPPLKCVSCESEDSRLPEDALDAANNFGGDPDNWSQYASTGWVLRSPGLVTVTVPDGWRIDYMAPQGDVYSCGDVYEPGQYGPLTIRTQAATLWYVPNEQACPSWTAWGQAQS